jgi:hypothetical protein
MKVIVVISGFTQKNHQDTGSKRLWRELHMLDDLCKSEDAIIDLREWDTDWKSYSKYINSLEPSEGSWHASAIKTPSVPCERGCLRSCVP